jgi:carbon storage regulator
MLVLTRKYQEKIRIGDNITITVLRTKGKAVRLGIEAPTDVPVIRGELSFEHAPDSVLSASPAAAGTGNTATALNKRPGSRRSEASSPWATASLHQMADRASNSQSDNVGLKRMPRGKVADILPKLVAGSGPLRAMLDQR